MSRWLAQMQYGKKFIKPKLTEADTNTLINLVREICPHS
jgi:hypothetical protein